MNIAAEVARRLLEIRAIKLRPEDPFTWASGMRSPIYCDNRLALSHPDLRRLLIAAFVEKSRSFGAIDGIAGVATAGIPHGALLADRLDLPFIYVRSKAKGHGRQNLIEGEMPAGSRLLVIEDLISTGGSSLAAVEALRGAGFEVAGVLAIFTYGFPWAGAAFQTAGCPLDTLSSYPVLLEVAQEQAHINDQQLQTLQEWRKDPKAWSSQFD